LTQDLTARVRVAGIDLARQPTFADIGLRLAELLRDGVLVPHNARFDVTFPAACMPDSSVRLAGTYADDVTLAPAIWTVAAAGVCLARRGRCAVRLRMHCSRRCRRCRDPARSRRRWE
jgi:hypothetical protein